MNLLDPVDAAALRMFNETTAYIFNLEFGDSADPVPMIEATQAYADALKASLEREGGRERWLTTESTTG